MSEGPWRDNNPAHTRAWDSDGSNIHVEFAVSPDGRVTFTQRQVLAPDSVVTLRGERISGKAWRCVKEGC